MISKAVIPAAGRGTRMRPFSAVVPKELVPLGSRPALDFVLCEAAAAGLREIAIVVGPRKPLLGAYLEELEASGRCPGIRFELVVQPEPLGLADAIDRCRGFVAGEPFALLLPDNVLLHPEHRLDVLLDLYRETGRDVVGVIEVDESGSGRYGNCGLFDAERVREGVLRITRLHDKRPGSLEVPAGERLWRTCGRYVCHPELFATIDQVRPTIRGELDEVPVYQRIAAERGLYGGRLPQPLFDVGNPEGFLAACAHLHQLGSRRAPSASGDEKLSGDRP